MRILVVDNYDSFTYNLVHMLGSKRCNVFILRNDQITIELIERYNPDKILISPGPGRPEESGGSLLAIREFQKSLPILGVCLGHQAIAYLHGGKIVNAPVLIHGKTSAIKHDGITIFRKIPQQFCATRYHSLVVDRNSLPSDLQISAETEDGIVMGIRHCTYPLEGIQFHPESILTNTGSRLITNWLRS